MNSAIKMLLIITIFSFQQINAQQSETNLAVPQTYSSHDLDTKFRTNEKPRFIVKTDIINTLLSRTNLGLETVLSKQFTWEVSATIDPIPYLNMLLDFPANPNRTAKVHTRIKWFPKQPLGYTKDKISAINGFYFALGAHAGYAKYTSYEGIAEDIQTQSLRNNNALRTFFYGGTIGVGFCTSLKNVVFDLYIGVNHRENTNTQELFLDEAKTIPAKLESYQSFPTTIGLTVGYILS